MTESLWRVVVQDVKQRIAISGEAKCHITLMGQALRQRITGEATTEKYAAALRVFMTETKTKVRLESTEGGKVFIFTPVRDTQ